MAASSETDLGEYVFKLLPDLKALSQTLQEGERMVAESARRMGRNFSMGGSPATGGYGTGVAARSDQMVHGVSIAPPTPAIASVSATAGIASAVAGVTMARTVAGGHPTATLPGFAHAYNMNQTIAAVQQAALNSFSAIPAPATGRIGYGMATSMLSHMAAGGQINVGSTGRPTGNSLPSWDVGQPVPDPLRAYRNAGKPSWTSQVWSRANDRLETIPRPRTSGSYRSSGWFGADVASMSGGNGWTPAESGGGFFSGVAGFAGSIVTAALKYQADLERSDEIMGLKGNAFNGLSGGGGMGLPQQLAAYNATGGDNWLSNAFTHLTDWAATKYDSWDESTATEQEKKDFAASGEHRWIAGLGHRNEHNFWHDPLGIHASRQAQRMMQAGQPFDVAQKQSYQTDLQVAGSVSPFQLDYSTGFIPGGKKQNFALDELVKIRKSNESIMRNSNHQVNWGG